MTEAIIFLAGMIVGMWIITLFNDDGGSNHFGIS